jgi:aryl-alcohol dehydrogenase-like predicted oxidoreductase
MPKERSVHWLSDEFTARVRTLLEYSEDTRVPILNFAFSWLLSHPAVASVIAGASTGDQIRANVNSVQALTDNQIEELNRLTVTEG